MTCCSRSIAAILHSANDKLAGVAAGIELDGALVTVPIFAPFGMTGR